MVFCREGQPERAPLSLILPQLYLGAETDVTQDCLSARGISYVLSVSRCCPQPSFLPQSQYLRIPIDDSLRDDLLPWIPQALRFIDGAMSLGCSVIVHCAAGISRSPALAVAYVMYSLGMDLDHAYRFVKERRPTISPNFNFLGQLQLFQGTLPLKDSHANQPAQQPVSSSDASLLSASPTANDSSPSGLLSNHDMQDSVMDNNHNDLIKDTKADVYGENKNTHKVAPIIQNPKPQFTLSLSDKLKTLSIDPAEARPALSQQDANSPVPPASTHLQLPSLVEKRKSLTLSLTPVCSGPWSDHKEATAVSNSSCNQNQACSTPISQKGAPKGLGKARRRDVSGSKRSNSREASSRCRRERSEKRSCSSANREEQPKPKPNPAQQKGKADCKTLPKQSSTAALQQEAPACAVEAVEVIGADQSPMSPINMTINRLLGWGERMLLGVLLGPHIKVGQAALPYRC
ncbi:hypothetical protein NFI96_024594 [Prochilodus magdalenae]|nr:hypothetical protein NFI96_024594 [Prochilodus magdalenae]